MRPTEIALGTAICGRSHRCKTHDALGKERARTPSSSSLTPARCFNTDGADTRRPPAAVMNVGSGGASVGTISVMSGCDAGLREGTATDGASTARIGVWLDARKLRTNHSAMGSDAFRHRAAVWARWEVSGCTSAPHHPEAHGSRGSQTPSPEDM
jgi:hypothetical protein